MRKIRNRMDTVHSECKHIPNLKCQEAEMKPWDTMFMWDKYHMEDFYELADSKLWVIPFIHGSIS